MERLEQIKDAMPKFIAAIESLEIAHDDVMNALTEIYGEQEALNTMDNTFREHFDHIINLVKDCLSVAVLQ